MILYTFIAYFIFCLIFLSNLVNVGGNLNSSCYNFFMKKPFVILFAGPVGSGKSTIATHLSWNLDLPVFSNDAIRREIVANNLTFDQERYLATRNERLKTITSLKKSFIYDASVDRSWEELIERLKNEEYNFFVISLDISKEFLQKRVKLYTTYDEEKFNKWFMDHQNFLNKHGDVIGLSINDENFNKRLELALEKANNL